MESVAFTEGDKATRYRELLPQLASLFEGEPDLVANLANAAAAIRACVDKVSWVGFYVMKQRELVLGPFQGNVACVRIAIGKGVCGTAAAERRTVVVPDVDAFPGHIACDGGTKSEIVVPILRDGQVLAVLDLDSYELAAFDDLDAAGLQPIAELLAKLGMVRLVAVLLVAAACQGSGSDKPSPKPVPPEAAVPVDAAEVAEIDAAKIEEPEPPDPGKLIEDLGAIPAWQAVVDRAQLLARRGQHGVAYGRVGPTVEILGPPPEHTGPGKPPDAGMIATRYVWLVDDTEGNGTLGIRVLLGKVTASAGDRVAIAGAWMLDDDKRWYWAAETATPLPPAPPSDLKETPIAVPSHDVTSGSLPAGAHTISVAKDNEATYFQIVGPTPVRDGDGWLIANQLGDVPVARLILPGERASYGGQDMRAPDERWQLKRKTNYWVRIGKIRKPKPDEPANINARTAPIKLQ